MAIREQIMGSSNIEAVVRESDWISVDYNMEEREW